MVARAEVGSSSRSQIFSTSSDKGSSNDNNSNDNISDSSCVPGSHNGTVENSIVTGQDLSVAQYEDDIEKSVHLNQDGSITVEMKVRLKIKEEETIKWTTTVSRAGLSGDRNAAASSSEVCASNENVSECINPKDTPFLKSYKEEEGDSLQQFNTEVSDKDSELDLKTAGCTRDNSADLDVSSVAEDNTKPRFYRPPTPGPRRVRQKKAVVESVTLVSEQEVQEKTIGQFSYSEEIQDGENKSEYCMVAHSSRKKSSVINPKSGEMSESDLLKLSSDNMKEEVLFKVSHRSSDLLETTNRKRLEVPDEDELVENIVERSVMEQGTYNSLVSACKANIRGFIPSSKIYQAARPVSADCIQGSCGIKQIKRSLSSFIRYSEFHQSKEEIKCSAGDLLPVSQDAEHSASAGHSQMKTMVSPCSEAPTEKINPTTGFCPAVTESENQVSVSNESVVTTHLIDDSQSASSLTKKKKKRKPSNLHEQGAPENQRGKDISVTVKSEGMYTRKTTQDSTGEPMDNSSEVPQEEGRELFVKNESGHSDTRTCPEDEFYHQESVEQNGLSSKKATSSNNKKPAKVKSKSGKKKSVGSSTKSEDGLMMVDSNNESQHSQDTLSTEKPGTRPTNRSFEQRHNSSVISKPLSEVPKNLNCEKEKEDHILSSKKEKKQKKMKKNLSKDANKLNMPERPITLEALKQKDFQSEHSLENYVQSWLKNVLPNSVLPPIKKREGNVENTNDCDVPNENADKETKLVTHEVHGVEHNLSKKKLKPICELKTLEDSAKDSGENQTDSLIHANAVVVEEAKYTLKSEFHHDGKLQLFHETQDNEKKISEADIRDTNLGQRKKSEVAVQVDYTIVNEKMGIDLQNSCVSTMMLHELQSALLGLQKDHNGCIGKACGLSDLSPAAFGCSSNVLLAWLLVLNLRENLIGTVKDDLQKTTCSCSEIFTQLQFLKQTTVIEKVDELKAAFSHFQQSTENNLLHFGRELKKQNCTHCCENMPITEIPNGVHLHGNENSEEPCVTKGNVNSEDTLNLTGEMENSFDTEKDLCRETEILDLSVPKAQLDDQDANANSNTCSLASAIEPAERNGEMSDSLDKKSQDQDTDTSFANEDSETSIEPNSTVHSVISNDKSCVLDQDTSELEGERGVVHVATDKSEGEKADPKSAGNAKTPNDQLELVTETSAECNNEDYSVQEDKEYAETCEETSERLSTVSPLSFCYESKQITECDMSEGEQNLHVEEVENELLSDAAQLKKCLKSPATSDWSDYRPDSEETDYNMRASSDLTNESEDEAEIEKHYNTGYVKRTIERLYGKAEASFKPEFHKGFPYLSQVFQRDSEEFRSALMEKTISFSQEPPPSVEQLSHSSLPSQEFPLNLSKGGTVSRGENTSLPTPQPTPDREEAIYTDDCSGLSPKQHCQPSVQINEDEGILIDKGKWLLKENHLIRRSPPERTGMYGNLDTTSADTVLDANGDDVPYSHFGNLNQYPVFNEISSSELEEMAKPSENLCNYFNIPHNSDSDPFQDDLSAKSKLIRSDKVAPLPAASKEKNKPSAMVGSTSPQADTNYPAFTSVEFKLPDNKVHPLEQPLDDEPVQSQPAAASNTNRNALREEDSLDKLHAICGQHCPILMVTVTPINEEQRGYAYQKASDIENQLGQCLLGKKSGHLQWSGEDFTADENNLVALKSNRINKIANNIFNRFYANNTLDFISNFGILASSTLKDASRSWKLHVVEDVNVKPGTVSNCQNNASEHILSDLVIGTNSELPNRKPKICQTLRISLIRIVGEKFSPVLVDPAETCHSETFLKGDTSLNNTEHNASENLRNGNAFPEEEEEEEEGICFGTMDNGNSKDEKDL